MLIEYVDAPMFEDLEPSEEEAQRVAGEVRAQLDAIEGDLPCYIDVRGKERCTLQIHPDDAERLGLGDGALARIRSSAGEVEAPVELTDALGPGVVSLPHGWGHDLEGVRQHVAVRHAGVNSNCLTATEPVDPLSGNAGLNAIGVEVSVAR